MGYGGKVVSSSGRRELRAEAWTLQDIATELGVSKSSVSLWVRDVEFTPRPTHRGHRRRVRAACTSASWPRSSGATRRASSASAASPSASS